MRDQEEEQRSRGELHRPRRSFWVHKDSMGLLSEDVQDELDETPVCWSDERLPPEYILNMRKLLLHGVHGCLMVQRCHGNGTMVATGHGPKLRIGWTWRTM